MENIYLGKAFTRYKVVDGVAKVETVNLKNRQFTSFSGNKTALTVRQVNQILSTYQKEEVDFPPERCLWESSRGSSKTFDQITFRGTVYDRVI